jgi:hypothetical protein
MIYTKSTIQIFMHQKKEKTSYHYDEYYDKVKKRKAL